MYVPPPIDPRGTPRGGKPSLTAEQAGARLVSGLRWGTPGEPTVVTYAFRASAPGALPSEVASFERMTSQQIGAVENALKIWATVANIRFERVGTGSFGEGAYSNDATMLFAAYSGPGDETGFAYLPGDATAASPSGDVWINTDYLETYYVTPYGYGFLTYLHEIGHALGLTHPSDYDGGDASYAADAEYVEDSLQYTLMSYFDIDVTGGSSGSRVIPGGPLIDDIVAIQSIYGANPATGVGNTVYGARFTTLDPGAVSPAPANDVGALSYYTGYLFEGSDRPIWGTVWDAGGTDTFDFSQSAKAQLIDLRPGAFSNVYGATKTLSIAPGVTIENAVGGSGADEIVGNDAANILSGGAGADILYGGAGDDRLIGGADDDLLIGGAGRDVFVFGLQGGGRDRIEDFSVTEDRLDTGGYRITGVTEGGGDSVLTLVGGTITVQGVTGLGLADWNALRVAAPLPASIMAITPTFATDLTGKIAVTLFGNASGGFGTITLARTDGTIVSQFSPTDFNIVKYGPFVPGQTTFEFAIKQPLEAGGEYVLTVPGGGFQFFANGGYFPGLYGYVFSAPATPPPPPSQYVLVADAGVQATVSGTGSVAAGGVSGVQDITVRDTPGVITFGATFNDGGDRVHLSGTAAAWSVARSGSTVILSDGDTQIRLPAGNGGVDLIFADGIRTLKIDAAAGALKLGDQVVTTTAATITAAVGPATATGVADPTLAAQMILTGAGPVTVSGTMRVAGSTTTFETVIVESGSKITFGPSFNAGGDTIVLPGQASGFTAMRSGSTVILTSAGETVAMPLGTSGTTLRFAGGETRWLGIDTLAGVVRIDGQTIGTTPAALTPKLSVVGDDLMAAFASREEGLSAPGGAAWPIGEVPDHLALVA